MREVLVGFCMLFAVSARAAPAATVRAPVVVELFTAQGCADCPEANKLVGALAQRRDLLPITFSVDYWDFLGWRDTFASPEFTERQRAYVRRLKVGDLYTPEVVVAGAAEAPGVDAEKVDALISKAARAPIAAGAPRVLLNRRGTRVRISAGLVDRSADVWLVRYDPKPITVKVKGDDRKIRAVAVYNIVRELVRLGAWRGRARSFALPIAKAQGLIPVVLVQARDGGRIVAAAR